MNMDMNGLLREVNTENFLKDELNGTINSLKRSIQDRYINRVKNTIYSAQKECIQTPTKEAGLLMAMREFSTGAERERFDRAIEMINGLNTLYIIQRDMKEIQSSGKLHSLSDENSQNDVSPSLFNTLLLLSFMNMI